MDSGSIAQRLAKKQKEISVSEFFERNKHILGFDSPTRALITSVKEGVDNSLDVCEEAEILPEVFVQIKRVGRDEFRIVIEDNGPGIVKKQVPHIFGRLLYGSRFHSLRQTRGQQGLGISAAVMYAQLTTGKPSLIRSKVRHRDVAYEVELILDTKKNRPRIIRQDFVVWEKECGTRVELQVRGRYIVGKQSVFEYLKSTAIVNPHARLTFKDPDGRTYVFERASDILPPKTEEIKPHPQGIELGTLLKMAKETKSYKMTAFLQKEFSRISSRVAKETLDKADVPRERVPKRLTLEEAKRILQVVNKIKIMAPPTDCLSPIGERLIKKGLKNVLGDQRPEFYCPPVTREPTVFAGNPFQVEVGIVYGGNLPQDKPIDILRYANRVPLLYQQGACAMASAVEKVDWRRYGLEQRGGHGVPFGPAIVLVHFASTKVPYTSESKEAIANIPKIVKELENGLRVCGRKLGTHMKRKAKKAKTREKFDIVQKILPEIAEKSSKIVKKDVPDIRKTITKIMNVVWIDEEVVFEKRRHKVTVKIYNYTPKGQKLNLHVVVPPEHFDSNTCDPKPKEIKEDGRITWELKRVPSTEIGYATFELFGMDEDEYDETELYISGISPTSVVGAEPLPGDWDLRVKPPTVEEITEEETEEELDYDEVEEELVDEDDEVDGAREEASSAG
ncbi:MAG: DNA topoisomerase VI subunit B [Methanobacteriota archaeon]|nr:MAG: DNA topoisomerase VI subunit B [Euryarchaeota archaeon]